MQVEVPNDDGRAARAKSMSGGNLEGEGKAHSSEAVSSVDLSAKQALVILPVCAPSKSASGTLPPPLSVMRKLPSVKPN